ncbi:MAG: hypothetical protein QOJ27_1668 [Sphingomonadales bacterium]|nr:hypothetical protein [Sphingomonadales bacterium]
MKNHLNRYTSAAAIALLAFVPASGWGAALAPGAASLPYFTPKTKLTLGGALVLQRCVKDGVTATSTLAVTSAGVADTTAAFTLDGAYLSSALQKREITVDLNDSRTIKSINAASSDRTGTVVTNVLKVAGSVVAAIAGVPVVAAAPANPTSEQLNAKRKERAERPCNERTLHALELVGRLKGAIAGLRDGLDGANPDDAEAMGEQIQLLATQIGQITEQDLTVTLTAPLDVGNPTGSGAVSNQGTVRWTLKDFAKWFAAEDPSGACRLEKPDAAGTYFTLAAGAPGIGCDTKSTLFGVDYTVESAAAAPMGDRPAASRCRPAALSAMPEATSDEMKRKQSTWRECTRAIVLATPVPATVTISAAAEPGPAALHGFSGYKPGEKLASAPIVVPQWGATNYLSLDVGLFRSRTIGLSLDEFGRRQTFKWNSEATAENVTGGLVTATEAGLAVLHNAEGPTDTAKWTAESAEIEARMNRNKWRVCETAIANGATKCE